MVCNPGRVCRNRARRRRAWANHAGLAHRQRLPVASGTERVLFLSGQQARAIVVLLPSGDGIITLIARLRALPAPA
ncbi:MAG TPA: hypothetical protein VKG22_03245 [Stellaceae bacterium]|nr:hypothetical protein [Stellaceae bacterium]HMD65650.1 hypothetical protein [Stellaceae bacterium]